MSWHLASQRSRFENGDGAAGAAWLVLPQSERRTAVPASLGTSMHSSLAILGGVRAICNSKKPSPHWLIGRIKECKNSQDFLKLLSQHQTAFNHIHVTAAWSKFKMVQRGGDRGTRIELVQLLHELTESNMQSMDGRSLSNILHAIAKMGVTPEAGLLRAMQGRATAVAGEFNPQDVANTVGRWRRWA